MIKWPHVMRPLATLALCGVVVTSLQGCVEMLVGTAVMSSLAVSDRRTIGAQTEDKTIVVRGESRIPGVVGNAGHVNISSFNRKVLLTGEVRDEAMKAAVEREVNAIDGVQSVDSELAIMPVTSFKSRSSDTLITGEVKASFVDAKDLYANSFKVVTERGTVYLMGRVTQREGRMAGEIASGVGGVMKVVKVFEYIGDDELKQLHGSPDKQSDKTATN
ncbi:MAG TPA: transporter [Oxalobacteraceae bacterium]|nr:transporter [Oxalobacteraceae bacterium]